MNNIALTPTEIEQLTAGAQRKTTQLKRLRDAGYTRARIVDGTVVVEREHALAVCHGIYGRAREAERPRVAIPERARSTK